ncbi:MAG: hypothetical protein WC491_05855 [Candidatus Omnitrophota bacterium]|jgi:hypothetical protein
MYIETDEEVENLYKRAVEQLQEARLKFISAEAGLREIEDDMARIRLKKNGIFVYVDIGNKVFVDFKDEPNTLCVFDGTKNGEILLRRVNKRGNPLKTVIRLPWKYANYVKKAA